MTEVYLPQALKGKLFWETPAMVSDFFSSWYVLARVGLPFCGPAYGARNTHSWLDLFSLTKISVGFLQETGGRAEK